MTAAQLTLQQRFERAEVVAREAVQFAEELNATNIMTLPQTIVAVTAAVRGDEAEAERRASAVLEITSRNGLVTQEALATWALAVLDLSRGRWAQAFDRLERLGDLREVDAVVLVFCLPDQIEAAIRAGRRDAALAGLGMFEQWASGAGPAWTRPRLAGFRALLAEGEEDGGHFEAAIELAADARPFDLARIHFSYGEHLRRERRRADARAQLRAAVEGFERLRAEPWAERARVELRATGETARKRDASTVDQLTPQERQISRLVADGLTNKEIAAQLFLSPRTIDSQLRNVFSKLGVKSRTQLARLPLGEDDPVAERAAVG